MKNRAYLLMMVLLGIFSFSPSEARIIASDGASVGPPSGSVTIPVKSNPSIIQRLAFKSTINWGDGTSQSGKISDSQSPLPQDRVKLPKKDTNQQPRKQGDAETLSPKRR